MGRLGGQGQIPVMLRNGSLRMLSALTTGYPSPEYGESDECRFTACVLNTGPLRWWLLGFGADVEVLGPKVLREEIPETALALMAHYRKPQVYA